MNSLSTNTAGPKKPLWQTPEGIGLILIAIAGVSTVIWAWGTLLPFLIKMLQDTLHFAALCAVVAVLVWILTNRQLRMLAWNLYRIFMRGLAGLVITIDPIGILKNKIEEMESDKEKLDAQVGLLDGAREKLRRKLQAGAERAKDLLGKANAAKKRLADCQAAEQNAKARGDVPGLQQAQLQRMECEKATNLALTEAGGLQEMNQRRFAPLLNKMDQMWGVLTRASSASDFIIKKTKIEVDLKETEYEAVKTSYKALSSAMSVINGNPDSRALFEQSLAYIEDDITKKLGSMRQMMEVTSQVVTNMDLENDASLSKGIELLDQYMSSGDMALFSGIEDTSAVGMGSIGVHPQNTLPPAIPIQDSLGSSKNSAHVHTDAGKSEWD